MEQINTASRPVRDWQAWLERYRQFASAAGWREYVELQDAKIPAVVWAATYNAPVQSALMNAMLCAALQLPESEALAAIGAIAREARAIRFGRPPKTLASGLRTLYRDSTRQIARSLPGTADVFEQIFSRYVRGDYDAGADANVLLQRGRALVAARDRDGALDAMSQAGAAMLRGSRCWSGWSNEGGPEFRQWAMSLLMLTETFEAVLPLASVAEERARAAERVAALSNAPARAQNDMPQVPQDPKDLAKLTSIWVDLLKRGEALSDDEIRAMGDQYQWLGDMAAQFVLNASALIGMGLMDDAEADDDEGDDGDDGDDGDEDEAYRAADMAEDGTEMAVDVLGLLRYGTPDAIAGLIDVVAAVDEFDDEIGMTESAGLALERIGSPALDQCFDFVRYSEQWDARHELLRVLGVVGRGNEEVYQYLVNEFSMTSWADGKAGFALPLALLHDPRAVPLIISALREPTVADDDAWELLDALQELEITFYVNKEQRAVNIPNYGIIEDVLPEDWKSRGELQAEVEAEDWDDLAVDGYEDDEDDEKEGFEDYGDVVYDKDGIPRCPDCGKEMHYVNGEWVHGPLPPEPKRPKSKSSY